MLTFALITGAGAGVILLVVIVAAWLMLSLMTASYGANRGFSLGPLFVCSVFLGFPLVLLAITIGAPILKARTNRETDGTEPGSAH